MTIVGSTQTVTVVTAKLEARNANLLNGVGPTGAIGAASPYFGIYDFVLDAAGAVEVGTTGQWTSLALVAADGLHPSSPLGHSTIAAMVRPNLLANVK